MTPALAFRLVNLAVLPVWAVWIAAPRSRAAGALASNAVLFLVPCVLYAVLLGAALAGGGMSGDFGYEGVRAAFARPLPLLAGWVHYLAFDLFVGAWVLRESRRIAVEPRVFLLFTLLAGPLGLGGFLLRRAARLRSFRQVGETDLI